MRKNVRRLLISLILYQKKVIDESLVSVHRSKKVLTLNKLIYVGFCILELSK